MERRSTDFDPWNLQEVLQTHSQAQASLDLFIGQGFFAQEQQAPAGDSTASAAASFASPDQKTIIRRRCRPRQKCTGDAVQIEKGTIQKRRLQNFRYFVPLPRPHPCPHVGLISSIKFIQPPSLYLLLGQSPPMRTSFMNGPLELGRADLQRSRKERERSRKSWKGRERSNTTQHLMHG